MLNKYSLENITKITINDKDYYLYNQIVQKLGIFDFIFNGDIIEKSDIVIKWPISEKLVVLLFELLDGTSKRPRNYPDNLSELLQFISFAKYLLTEENVIYQYICKYFKNNDSILDFAKECSKIANSTKEFAYIFKIFQFRLGNDIQNTLNSIHQLDLEINFKTMIIIACLHWPYQNAYEAGYVHSSRARWGRLYKSKGFSPLNGYSYYYYHAYNDLQSNMTDIDDIIINKIKYTNCTLHGMPEIHDGDIISCKIIGDEEYIVNIY